MAPLNIVLYNVFSDHGPDLYGTSPWTFYFLNGFLNFNVVFPLALAALPTVALTQGVFKLKAIKSRSIPLWLALVPLYVWILIFFTQPHKVQHITASSRTVLCRSSNFSWWLTCLVLLHCVDILHSLVVSHATNNVTSLSLSSMHGRVYKRKKGFFSPSTL